MSSPQVPDPFSPLIRICDRTRASPGPVGLVPPVVALVDETGGHTGIYHARPKGLIVARRGTTLSVGDVAITGCSQCLSILGFDRLTVTVPGSKAIDSIETGFVPDQDPSERIDLLHHAIDLTILRTIDWPARPDQTRSRTQDRLIYVNDTLLSFARSISL